jgi:hypothetical protein
MPARKAKKNWIAGAVHPKAVGAYTRRAKKHGGMAKTIAHDLHSHNPKTRHRAQFASAMRSIARKHKH